MEADDTVAYLAATMTLGKRQVPEIGLVSDSRPEGSAPHWDRAADSYDEQGDPGA